MINRPLAIWTHQVGPEKIGLRKMTVEIIDRIQTIKMKDSSADAMDAALDMRAVAHIWMLLGGVQGARDHSIFSRQLS
jgi:hypothetical protein